MTKLEKLEQLKIMLNVPDEQEKELGSFLDFAEITILNRLYSLIPQPTNVTTVPLKYDSVQIQAVVIGWNMRGAENETTHNENGTNRSYRYSSMVEYINSSVSPYVRLVG